MIRIITAVLASAALVSVYATTPSVSAEAGSCSERAAKQKLAGAALKSFMTKCEKEAAASCDLQAGKQKLAGAAKSSFTKKCVSTAVGGGK